MEEWVGQIWHGFITRSANREYPEASVSLEDMRKTLSILFRALGGDAGLQIRRSSELTHGARRTLLQKVAGSGEKASGSWRDSESLSLPETIAVFPEESLNRDLYLWLAALASTGQPSAGDFKLSNYFSDQQAHVRETLQRYPLLAKRYERLVQAYIPLRPNPNELKGNEKDLEVAIQQGLTSPETGVEFPGPGKHAPQPVALWLRPPPIKNSAPANNDTPPEPESNNSGPPSNPAESEKRHQAESTEMPDGRSGLLSFRLESMFSWTEFLPLDRTADEQPDDDAQSAADDMDIITVARDRKASSHKIKLDLDLPSEDFDDIPIGTGTPLPEWDYRKQTLIPDFCRVQMMIPRDSEPSPLPPRLQLNARKLRRRFEALQPRREWLNNQPDGAELDTDSYILHLTESKRGRSDIPTVYRDCRERGRDLSCLVLADFSMSTDSWVSKDARIVDVVKDSLILFAEALSATRDRLAMYGFSSLNRQNVRMYRLKSFKDKYDDLARGRILATTPGYYTRMGAAIRYASNVLVKEATEQKLLLLITDGKPNDLDIYEGRYGLEDTRMALQEAKKAGLTPFCVTIDDKAEDYLPHLFGQQGWALVRNVEELPQKLPQLYALLTGR